MSKIEMSKVKMSKVRMSKKPLALFAVREVGRFTGKTSKGKMSKVKILK
jgi:hypothetical protein